VAGRIRSIEKSSDLIGNRTCIFVNERNFYQLKSAISNLKHKLPASPAAVCGVETSQPYENSFISTALTLNYNDVIGINNENGSVVCSYNLVSCNVCTNGGVSGQSVPTSVSPYNANSYLSPTDFHCRYLMIVPR
jgi:hypothetical protein